MVVDCSPRLALLLHLQMAQQLYDLLHRLLVVELRRLILVLERSRPCLLGQGHLLASGVGPVPPRFASGQPFLCIPAHAGLCAFTCRLSRSGLGAVQLG